MAKLTARIPCAEHLGGGMCCHPHTLCRRVRTVTSCGAVQVVVTISQGKVVWENEKLNVKEGAGRFIKLPTGGELFAGLAEQDETAIARAFPYGVPGKPVQRDLTEKPSRDEL